MTQKRKHYETPQLTVAEFKTERGYAESVLYTGSIFMMFNSSLGEYHEGLSQVEGQVFQNFGWSDEFNND